jgi:hypothetical protein
MRMELTSASVEIARSGCVSLIIEMSGGIQADVLAFLWHTLWYPGRLDYSTAISYETMVRGFSHWNRATNCDPL